MSLPSKSFYQRATHASITSSFTAFQVFLHVTFSPNLPNSNHCVFILVVYVWKKAFALLIQHPRQDQHPSKKRTFPDELKSSLNTFSKGCQKYDKYLYILFILNQRELSGLAFQGTNFWGIQKRYIYSFNRCSEKDVLHTLKNPILCIYLTL